MLYQFCMNLSHREILPSTFVERQNDKLKVQLHQGMVLDQLSTIKGRTMGLEPTNGGTTILCLNHLATPAIALL